MKAYMSLIAHTLTSIEVITTCVTGNYVCVTSSYVCVQILLSVSTDINFNVVLTVFCVLLFQLYLTWISSDAFQQVSIFL